MSIKRILPAVGAAWLLAAPFALAQTAASSEAMGATTGLGTSHRFKSAAVAASHCPGDSVIWVKRHSMSYVANGGTGYGHGGGFYACKMEADSAGFHG